MSSTEERTIPIGEVVVPKQTHSSEAKLRDTDDFPITPSSEQIKNWVDEKNSKSVMVFPRKLSITWSDDPNYWTWFPNKDSPNETGVEAAELKNVCWLEITGKFDVRNLTPGITYEVVFKVKLEDPAYGWDTPVNVKLVLPNGKPQEKKVSLRDQPRYKWIDIKAGEFVPEKSATGEITFSMYEHEAGVWKKGLFLKGVAIRPKSNI